VSQRGLLNANFSVERMAAGGVLLQNRAVVARRHRSPWRWAALRALKMNRLLYIAVLLAVTGCGKATSDPKRHLDDILGAVPPDVALRVSDRIQLLKPGMSQTQVVTTLGLSGYHPTAIFGGPPHRSYKDIRLREGCGLRLVYNETGDVPLLLSAELSGEGWGSLSNDLAAQSGRRED
jgi:hypothetical protein